MRMVQVAAVLLAVATAFTIMALIQMSPWYWREAAGIRVFRNGDPDERFAAYASRGGILMIVVGTPHPTVYTIDRSIGRIEYADDEALLWTPGFAIWKRNQAIGKPIQLDDPDVVVEEDAVEFWANRRRDRIRIEW